MWAHFFEAMFQGVALFVFPLLLVAAMAGALKLLDRAAHHLPGNHHIH